MRNERRGREIWEVEARRGGPPWPLQAGTAACPSVVSQPAALVTGATGFVGPYLIEELLRDGWTVWALDRTTRQTEAITSLQADLREGDGVRRALYQARPTAIFHLAAQSSVSASFQDPIDTLENNFLGAANLLYAAAELDPKPVVVTIGSAEEYGKVQPEQLPLDESAPLAPVSPYGISKAAQSLLALGLHRSHALPAIVMRPFNHTGPKQSHTFVVPSFARQIARIEAGLEEPVIRVGNLQSRRDFTDVRDIVKAYVLAVRRGEPGEVYNLGSGHSVTIHAVLHELLLRSHVDIEVQTDPDRMVRADLPDLRANSEKFRAATGWAPSIKLEQTLEDVLNYWRIEVSSEQVATGRSSLG